MGTGRLEAFSDGVIAIVITIIVLLIDLPDGDDIGALARMVPLVAAYAVSFILIGMRWANHHHLLQVTEKVNGKIMWANLLYLFAAFPLSDCHRLGGKNKLCSDPHHRGCFAQSF